MNAALLLLTPAVAPPQWLSLGRVALVACACLTLGSGCRPAVAEHEAGTSVRTTLSRIKTLDPALASDVPSCLVIGHLYDRLLQYAYEARPYTLEPAMAVSLPETEADGLVYRFRLRPGLVFAADPCFGPEAESKTARQICARDVVFSLLRLADARVHSSGYWTLRGYLEGLERFHEQTLALPPDDYSLYEAGIAGLRATDTLTVEFRLTRPYPRLLQVLAMTYGSVLPERAIRYYGSRLAEHAVGSGPFRVEEWRRNYRLIMARNPDYRLETYPGDAARLPLADRVVCYVVQEPLTAWLLFLQGELDVIDLTGDTLEAAVSGGVDLNPELAARGVRLLRVPEFQVNYVAFNAEDPVLGQNLALRQAISLAYDVGARLKLSNHQLTRATGPIPPGVSGHDPAFHNPFSVCDIEKARRLLSEAGYPGGIDPRTGQRLRLRFDLGGTDLARRQQAELMVADMRQLGIEIEPCLSSWPQFLEKLQRGDVQLFRVAWVGDYPDGQNFLQLFYGPNANSCNRSRYRNPAFDALYEQAVGLPDTPERADLYRRMQELVVADCAWIFESYPTSSRLVQSWVGRYIPHHFAPECWKYVGVDAAQRTARVKTFRPLKLTAQRHP